MHREETAGIHKVITRTVHILAGDAFLLIQEIYTGAEKVRDIVITLSRDDIKALAETEQSTPKGYTGTDK